MALGTGMRDSAWGIALDVLNQNHRPSARLPALERGDPSTEAAVPGTPRWQVGGAGLGAGTLCPEALRGGTIRIPNVNPSPQSTGQTQNNPVLPHRCEPVGPGPAFPGEKGATPARWQGGSGHPAGCSGSPCKEPAWCELKGSQGIRSRKKPCVYTHQKAVMPRLVWGTPSGLLPAGQSWSPSRRPAAPRQ